ncbi:MAG: ABC transporter ATP-binding protein [Bryobacterales bacterium]|nr:ABC transporter ATP-binding protein [Bryobacterales bacterium]
MLEATQICKSYPTAQGPLSVLRDVSFRLDPGESMSIMGPSGSGKSTLLYIIGVLESPTSGSFLLDGENPFTFDEARQARFRNQKLGFLFQDHCLLPQLSVLENVLTPVLVDGPPNAATMDRARMLLDQVGLSPRLNHRPGELSGGEKQRAALARALIREPRVLLCDEPTGNLDRKSADAVADLLAGLPTTVVVVTHSPELAGRFALRMEMHDQSLRRR